MLTYSKTYEVKETKRGYRYFIDKEHPLAIGNSGLVYEHRHIASMTLGRWVSSTEVVHHINGNKKDNSSSNLVVLTSGEHTQLHKGMRSKRSCKRCGNEFTVMNKRIRYCSKKCSHLGRRKAERPDLVVLKNQIAELGFEGTGRHYGVTGNAIKNWLKSLT